jgi:hypothetical protein
MERIARLSETSPVDGNPNLPVLFVTVADVFLACLELVPFYAVTNEMNPVEFASFTKPTNFTAQILLAHFWMLTLVLQRHVLGPARVFAMQDEVVLQWVERAALQLPESHKRYVLWPLGMAKLRATRSGELGACAFSYKLGQSGGSETAAESQCIRTTRATGEPITGAAWTWG